MKHSPQKTILFLVPFLAVCYLIEKQEIDLLSYFERAKEVEAAPVWSELNYVDTLLIEELEIDTIVVDTIALESLLSDTLEINHNRWFPKYAKSDLSTLPDSLKFEGSDIARASLRLFFAKLEAIDTSDTNPIEVFHWGDSQIEGDRITGVLRSSWQKSWGGNGPGLIPAVQPIPALSIKQRESGSWKRYTRFGKIDSTITHNAYGAMAAFSRVKGEGTVTLKPNPAGFKLNKRWGHVKFLIGDAPLGGNITLKGSATPYKAFSIRPNRPGMHTSIVSDLTEGEKELTVGFEGYNIEVTGIELGSRNGVVMHNIPLRGSAGMIFTKLDRGHLESFMEERKVGLVVLQFGGNVVPYLKDSVDAQRYAKRFRKQLKFLKLIMPEAAVIVIGPSDMGTAGTYPMLGSVIDNLKEQVMLEDCMYWDLRRVMGGEGSMERWSNLEPRLASTDLIHFSPKGARVVGEKFDEAFRAEYKSWVKWMN